jgi:hypothetical protein
MHEVTINKEKFAIPSDFTELTDEQLLAVVPYKYAEKPSHFNLIRLLWPKRNLQYMKLKASHIYELTHWVLEKPLVETNFTKFTHDGTEYLLPDASLATVVLFEYAMASYYLRVFCQSNKEEYLNMLVATICRPPQEVTHTPDWNGDLREKYNSALTKQRAKDFETLNFGVKVIVLHVFLEAQARIQKRFASIFKAPDEGETPKINGVPYTDLMYDLSKTGIYGDYEKVCFTNIHTVFFNLAQEKSREKSE